MRAHILTIGNEILAGDILDTNFRELAAILVENGVLVTAHVTVPDEVEAIAAAVRRGFAEAEMVVVTGGLGPTPDDLTREGVARALGVGQARRQDLVPALHEIFSRFGSADVADSNYRQLDLPEGAEPIPNSRGTAPGFLILRDGCVLFAVPGIPREMHGMVEATILPWLREHRRLPVLQSRVVRTMGIGESDLAERVRDLADSWRGVGLAFYPQTPGVDLKLSHHGKDARRLDAELDAAESSLRDLLGPLVYGGKGATLAGAVGELLLARGWTLGCAESCTGGALAAAVTAVPGASRYFDRGVICYSNSAKTELLGVAETLLDEHGAVSEPTARAMAEGLRARAGVDVAVATTGIAGPDGGTPEKPVGLVHLALATPEGSWHWITRNPGSRDVVVRRTVGNALNRLRLVLLGDR